MELKRYLMDPEILLRLAQEAGTLSEAAYAARVAQDNDAAKLKESAAGVAACLTAIGIDTDSEEMRTLITKVIIRWIAELERSLKSKNRPPGV